MSIKPLDLQTMFVRLNDVGKEQSHNQQASALQQNQEARKLVEQELQRNSSVDASKEDKESRKVDDKEADSGKKEEGHQQAASAKEEKKKQKIVQDPEMGIHIDISG
ncbi:MAG: hypothetical protein B6241_04430 [Spirochaetaceae bacterium 4572_59]|nr:MAG: hypothetical protein B6241_04430 [Spirochaetaceae bacterium 4572_59]